MQLASSRSSTRTPVTGVQQQQQNEQAQLDSCHHFNRLHLHPDALVLALDHSNWWHLQTDALLCCTRVLSTQRPGSIQVTGLLSNCNLALRHLHACWGVRQAWALLPWTPMCFNILKRFNLNAECIIALATSGVLYALTHDKQSDFDRKPRMPSVLWRLLTYGC